MPTKKSGTGMTKTDSPSKGEVKPEPKAAANTELKNKGISQKVDRQVDERGSVRPAPLKVRNRIAEEQDAAAKRAEQLQQQLVESKDKMTGSFEPIGVWQNPAAVEKLGLHKLNLEKVELVLDVVPDHPEFGGGCSTNGVNFPPGSVQLLPAEFWADIKGRISTRIRNEENFYRPKKRRDYQHLKRYTGANS